MTSTVDTKEMLNNIIGWGFCDIQNNQGGGRSYQPEPKAEADNLTETLIVLDITKTESNNCYFMHWMNPFFLAST